MAHRAVYLHLMGPLPKGVPLMHRCGNRACVNPAHKWVSRRREVAARGRSPAGVNARKVACKHGHPFSPENTEWRKDGSRRCKTCHAAHQREWGREPQRRRAEESA